MTHFTGQRLHQNAFTTSDVDASIASWLRLGVGPWFVARAMKTGPISFRGERTELTLSVALAMCGQVEVELIQQICRTPSIYTEGPEPVGRERFHHLAWLSDA